MSYRIFTNNPLLDEHLKKLDDFKHEIVWMRHPASDVLVAVRTAVRKGAALASNLMSGVRSTQNKQLKRSTPPGFGLVQKPVAHNPYISVLVTPAKDAMDFQSIKQIEEALTIYRKNAGLRFMAHRDESVLQFQQADMDCLLEALAGIEDES
ncbi:MAG: hypothetical protein FWC73_05960 [Defluviitaleaceae bacterium]|nr:hypothetical protein [Defluviitaleaceae bacterium]